MRTRVGILPARICFAVLECFHWKSRRDMVICVLNRLYVPGAEDCSRYSAWSAIDRYVASCSQGRRALAHCVRVSG